MEKKKIIFTTQNDDRCCVLSTSVWKYLCYLFIYLDKVFTFSSYIHGEWCVCVCHIQENDGKKIYLKIIKI